MKAHSASTQISPVGDRLGISIAERADLAVLSELVALTYCCPDAPIAEGRDGMINLSANLSEDARSPVWRGSTEAPYKTKLNTETLAAVIDWVGGHPDPASIGIRPALAMRAIQWRQERHPKPRLPHPELPRRTHLVGLMQTRRGWLGLARPVS